MSKSTSPHLSLAGTLTRLSDSLLAGSELADRELGRILLECEPLGFYRVEPTGGRQGVEIHLGVPGDLDFLADNEPALAMKLSKALGLWKLACQVKFTPLDSDEWILTPTEENPILGRRLDRYLSAAEPKPNTEDIRLLKGKPAMSRILLRRLRYQLAVNHGNKTDPTHLIFWTTPTTQVWAAAEGIHLQYLTWYLLRSTPGINFRVDEIDAVDTNHWGMVDTDQDPLRIWEITTPTGVTYRDTQRLFEEGGSQLSVDTSRSTPNTDRNSPLLAFAAKAAELINELNALTHQEHPDIIFFQRGGGIDSMNSTPDQKVAFLKLITRIRDFGVEVVVGMGHGDTSFVPDGTTLPSGIFEATTPTAGAAWILREHINNRLLATTEGYKQT